jgi:hypothetical protein
MKEQNFFKNIDSIKKLESEPEIVELFDKEEVKKILSFYKKLPTGTYNEKQKIIKKHWIIGIDKEMDNLLIKKINTVLKNWKVDNMYCTEDALGIFHESYFPLKLHVDSGKNPNAIIYKQILIPLSEPGETLLFEPRWYGESTSFTVNENELALDKGYNKRSNAHIGKEDFDKGIYRQYLSHENYKNLQGLTVKKIYNWKVGQGFIFDRNFIHCSSGIKNSKIGFTIFFNQA